ncbi:hypothetical protein MHYP_G00291950 [Metynnis hypsauchen]
MDRSVSSSGQRKLNQQTEAHSAPLHITDAESISPLLLRASSEALVISLGRSILPAIQRCHFRLIYLANAYPRLSPDLIHGMRQKGDELKWRDQYNHEIALKP